MALRLGGRRASVHSFSVWSMGKDGHSYWPLDRQIAAAERIASYKGQTPHERNSLKQRLLRNWMGK